MIQAKSLIIFLIKKSLGCQSLKNKTLLLAAFGLLRRESLYFFSLSPLIASSRQTAWINVRDWIGCMRIWLLNKRWVLIFCRVHQSEIELPPPAESRAWEAHPSSYVNSVSLPRFSAASPFFIPFLPNRFPSWGYNDVTATTFCFFHGLDTGEIVKKNDSVIITHLKHLIYNFIYIQRLASIQAAAFKRLTRDNTRFIYKIIQEISMMFCYENLRNAYFESTFLWKC